MPPSYLLPVPLIVSGPALEYLVPVGRIVLRALPVHPLLVLPIVFPGVLPHLLRAVPAGNPHAYPGLAVPGGPGGSYRSPCRRPPDCPSADSGPRRGGAAGPGGIPSRPGASPSLASSSVSRSSFHTPHMP